MMATMRDSAIAWAMGAFFAIRAVSQPLSVAKPRLQMVAKAKNCGVIALPAPLSQVAYSKAVLRLRVRQPITSERIVKTIVK